MKTRALTLIILMVLIGLMQIDFTQASFSDQEQTSALMTAGYWAVPEPEASPEEHPAPDLHLHYKNGKRSVEFKAQHLEGFVRLSYVLTYDTDTVPQAALGEVELEDEKHYQRVLVLGICSSGGTCVYHEGVRNIRLVVTLYRADDSTVVLEQTL